MNETVAGSYIEHSPEGLIDADAGFVDRFDLVIATQVGATDPQSMSQASLAASECWATHCTTLAETPAANARRRYHPPQLIEPHLLSLEALCRAKGVKLLAVRSYGLMGYMRVGGINDGMNGESCAAVHDLPSAWK